jgi:hypothetical protein
MKATFHGARDSRDLRGEGVGVADRVLRRLERRRVEASLELLDEARAVQRGEESEPITATPRVPPSSRVASLTAEPTPARAGGSTCMIDSVAGVVMRPRPRPISTISGTTVVT